VRPIFFFFVPFFSFFFHFPMFSFLPFFLAPQKTRDSEIVQTKPKRTKTFSGRYQHAHRQM